MSAMARVVMQRFYHLAQGSPERLPWHRAVPPEILIAAAETRRPGERALDVGCGAGGFAVWLAARGLQVTGVDLFAEATAMARAAATARGVTIECVCGDLFDFAPDRPFDLILDSGCLHSLVGGTVASYRRRVLDWLAPGGDYVLEHWGKRHALDWRPVGPRRRSPSSITRIFAPDLELLRTDVTDFAAPLPFGPTVRGIGYWFGRR
jgi:cyclopropane fatty-acyl-phospholipid synthase-like methyltransferase